jgi:hypothetical protein
MGPRRSVVALLEIGQPLLDLTKIGTVIGLPAVEDSSLPATDGAPMPATPVSRSS